MCSAKKRSFYFAYGSIQLFFLVVIVYSTYVSEFITGSKSLKTTFKHLFDIVLQNPTKKDTPIEY